MLVENEAFLILDRVGMRAHLHHGDLVLKRRLLIKARAARLVLIRARAARLILIRARTAPTALFGIDQVRFEYA